mmetsp:Transcript_63018/g.150120  ORF Transcript_63018/g.150120 Transcript_63018/m.150120 type:complete len:484 (+) Transcript_63018:98-1549(+)|eukprot:CAMPEP_0178415140 /NCGR_PEP_ID=MMETSP0689_2-20121128/23400_1 /TAXON_ID=160604 /ORGANISM="Amphidinium massartii, Strain CS-259" /LENGTH=483 /DNA_ID=CAMNT_0020036455 /DNA_START=86 /DNA_END=1537 /DNA_ORIENTATION=+
MRSAAQLLCLAAVGKSVHGYADVFKSSFTVYSDPIELRYGEVYNKMQTDGGYAAHMLPADVVARYASGDKKMAITNFTMDMVRIAADGTETPVLLSDHYLHHYILNFGEGETMKELLDKAAEDTNLQRMLTGCHGMRGMGVVMFQDYLREQGKDPHLVSFGSAAGAEYRHNPQQFEAPYSLVLTRPSVLVPTYHIINTKDDTDEVSQLLECPCTPQRRIDPAAGTIDGQLPDPEFDCSREFKATGNPSCGLDTYVGGWRCCEHGVFVIDTAKECWFPRCWEKPKDRIFMKFNFAYEDATEETRPIEPGACCDTTSDSMGFGNLEHDVPQCKDKENGCLFVTESVVPLGYYDTHHHSRHAAGSPVGSDLVDLVFAAPHLHWAGLSMELIDDVTNKTLCKVERKPDNSGGVIYGTGQQAGNEKGYLVGLEICSWNLKNAPRYRRDHPMRARSVYDASQAHTGVMSLWLTHVAAVPSAATASDVLE